MERPSHGQGNNPSYQLLNYLPSLHKEGQQLGNSTWTYRLLFWSREPTEKSPQITGNCTLNSGFGKEPGQTEM